MEVRNCRSCGNLFNYVTGAIMCPACRDKMEIKFQEVKEYIRANPGVVMRQVSEDCDVEQSQIQQWLREERLEVTEASAIYLSCESCGANIRSGRYCDKCKSGLVNGFRSAIRSNQPATEPRRERKSDSAKMRYLD